MKFAASGDQAWHILRVNHKCIFHDKFYKISDIKSMDIFNSDKKKTFLQEKEKEAEKIRAV